MALRATQNRAADQSGKGHKMNAGNTTPDTVVRPCFACTHEHDPNASGACFEVPCVDGCAACGTEV